MTLVPPGTKVDYMITRKADGKCVNCGAPLGHHEETCHFRGTADLFEKEDVVNHPKHYKFGNFEVIDVIEDWGLNYHRGNVVKYVARAGRKNPATEVQDLDKALWYLKRERDRIAKMQPDRGSK